jgi:cytochrome P450
MAEAKTAKRAEIDSQSEEFRANPYAEYARLREEAAVHRTDAFGRRLDSWLVNRYEEARAALGDKRLSRDSDVMGAALHRAGFPELAAPSNRTVFNTDPPEHTRLRRILTRALTRRRLEERMAPRVQQATDQLLDEIEPQEEVDLFDAFALPLSITLFCHLLGMPLEDRDQFRAWLAVDAAPEDRVDWWGAGDRYFTDLVARRRPTVRIDLPEDEQPDMVSLLIAARERQAMSESELIGALTVLLIASFDTTIQLVAGGMLALLRHPDQLRLLRERPELGPSATEELLRYTTPLQRTSFLVTTEGIELGGVAIPEDGLVYVGLGSANRDPKRFECPERLDITRADNAHLAFGHGVHFCLGAPLARLEGTIVIGTLLRRFPDISLACPLSEVRWRPYGWPLGLASLPVRLRGTAPAPAW